MKKNIYDRILGRTSWYVEGISDKIAGIFKGTAPFDTRRMTKDELLQHFNELPEEDRFKLFEQMGGRR